MNFFKLYILCLSKHHAGHNQNYYYLSIYLLTIYKVLFNFNIKDYKITKFKT